MYIYNKHLHQYLLYQIVLVYPWDDIKLIFWMLKYVGPSGCPRANLVIYKLSLKNINVCTYVIFTQVT